MEHFNVVKTEKPKHKKSKFKYSVMDGHRGYEKKDADIRLVCRLFKIDIEEACEFIYASEGYIAPNDGIAYFKTEKEAYDFSFKLQTQVYSLMVNGRVKYERF